MLFFSNGKTLAMRMMIFFAALLLSRALSANIVVVGNLNIKSNRLTRSQLSNLYLGKTSIINAQRISPLNLSDQSPVFAEFYRHIVGWSVGQVSSYWAQQVFSGTAQQPQAVSSMQAAIQYVRENSGAIAYVDTDKLTSSGELAGVKLLYGQFPGKLRSQSLMPVHSSRHLPMPWHSGRPSAGGLVSRTTNLYAFHRALSAHAGYPNAVRFTLPEVSDDQNLWQQMKLHFRLQKYYNLPSVVKQRHILLRNSATLNLMLDNAIPYIAYIYQQTLLRGQPAELVLLPMLESAYNPFAYSRVGAAGLWQMMPQTAVLYGLNISWWYDSRRDVLLSSQSALKYLQALHRQFNSWPLALASYDAGAGTVSRALRRRQRQHVSARFWQLDLPSETQAYVPKLLAIASIIENAKQYHVTLPSLSVKPFFTTVALSSQMDLAEISQMAGISTNLIRYLNPGLRRFATSNQGQYTLLLPTPSLTTFKRMLQANLGKKHISWQYHEVFNGETLKKIAHDYHTSLSLLKRVNGIEDGHVVEGQGILVPLYLGAKFTQLGHVGISKQVATIKSVSVNDLLSGKLLPALPQPAQTLPIHDHRHHSWEKLANVKSQQWLNRLVHFSLCSLSMIY